MIRCPAALGAAGHVCYGHRDGSSPSSGAPVHPRKNGHSAKLTVADGEDPRPELTLVKEGWSPLLPHRKLRGQGLGGQDGEQPISPQKGSQRKQQSHEAFFDHDSIVKWPPQPHPAKHPPASAQ